LSSRTRVVHERLGSFTSLNGSVQYDNRTVKCEKKIRLPLNITKVWSNVMLIMRNVTIEPLNVRKQIREPTNVTKIQSHVMLVLPNVMMKLLNVRKKN